MKLYIDKENIITFMSNRSENIELFEESLRLIKKNIEVHYNFPKSAIQGNTILSAWFGRMKGDGCKFKDSFYPDAVIKPERPIKSNFYINYDFDDRSSIYLLNIDKNKCNIIRDKRSILVGCPGEEMEIFKTMLEISDRPDMMTDIESWTHYCPKVPLTDVIISDNHYFKNKEVYEKNDNELIRALAAIPKDSISVVIITKEGEVDTHPRQGKPIDLKEECNNIKNLISSVSGLSKKKCSVTIITTNRTHSRHIITNYYTISPTSCIHLKENGLKEDADIFISPHTESKELNKTRRLIKLFQNIAKSPVRIYGDKKSIYIDFE